MIKLELTIREAMNLATSWAFNNDINLYHKIVDAFENTLKIDDPSKNCTVTITGGLTLDNRISCIKQIRKYTGWDLKQSKDWTDVFTGYWHNDRWNDSTCDYNCITLKHPNDAASLLRELTALGCEGYIS